MFLMSGTKWTFSSYHQNVVCSRHEIAENCSFGIEQQSLTHYIYVLFSYVVQKSFTVFRFLLMGFFHRILQRIS